MNILDHTAEVIKHYFKANIENLDTFVEKTGYSYKDIVKLLVGELLLSPKQMQIINNALDLSADYLLSPETTDHELESAISHLDEILNKEWECESCKQDHRQLWDFLVELQEYRKAMADGILSKSLCRVGDEVWFVNYDIDEEEYVLDGYVFLARCNDYIIATSNFAHFDKITEQLEEMSNESIENYGDVDNILILPIKNCFFTRKAAETEREKRNSEGSNGSNE